VQDRDFIVTTYQHLELDQYSSIVCSERSWLQADRAAVEKFMRATIRGWQDNATDPSVAAHRAVE
jgi:ABC-type nitrate/sulfonate/bicarbonate transport system substrate-binding protein